MNTRIKELAKQSGLIQYDSDGKLQDAEKFAQLIIQECVEVCLQQRDPSNLNYKPSEKFADAIKFHFGLPRV